MERNDRTTRRRRVTVLALVALLATAGACSRGSDDAGEGGSVAADAEHARPATGGVSASATGESSGAGGSAPAAAAAVAPALPKGLGADRVVKTASLEVEVADGGFAAAFAKVPGIAAANGGFVASSSSTRSGDEGRQSAGSLVVRVPADRFEATREQLVELGTLQSQQLEGEDVGGQLTDLDARLRNLRSHEEAIRVLMTKTGTIGETIEVQRQLWTVREQIEQLAAEQARLSDAVALSTITLALAEPGVRVNPPAEEEPLRHAVGRALAGSERVLAAIVVTLGYLAPLALLAGSSWLAVHQVTGRRRRPEPAPAPAP